MLAGVAAQMKAETAGKGQPPFIMGKFASVRGQPGDVLNCGIPDIPAVEEQRTTKYRVLPAKVNQRLDEFKKFPVLAVQRLPIDRGYFVILAISIVVALLRMAQFVAGQQHGDAL